MLQLARLVGERTLRDIVFGRYHRSRTEERFFLFVDIAGSTPLAERIGPDAVHRFLGEVFRLASDPIDDHRGEVHQFFPLDPQPFYVPLALPGDDVTPDRFVCFRFDGRHGLYIHPNIWHEAFSDSVARSASSTSKARCMRAFRWTSPENLDAFSRASI